MEPIFHEDSYGYRPKRSAIDAIRTARRRCWRYDWVLDMDIKGFFDNIDHELLLKAVRHHTDCRWVLLYVERWLKAPVIEEDGTVVARDRGTPQGGVISPVLSKPVPALCVRSMDEKVDAACSVRTVCGRYNLPLSNGGGGKDPLAAGCGPIGRVRPGVRWRRFVGQADGVFKVYSG